MVLLCFGVLFRRRWSVFLSRIIGGGWGFVWRLSFAVR